MKMTRKILPALLMLVVSAIMLSTASLAWFAMNPSVEATGMTVNVKSDSVYLLIVAEDNEGDAAPAASEIQTANTISATGVGLDKDGKGNSITDVYPSAYYNDSLKGEDGEGDRTIKVSVGGDFKTASNWYYATAQDASTSDMKTDSDTPLTTFAEYVVRYKYYVTLAAGSSAIDNLKVSGLTITDKNGTTDAPNTLDPLKVVVACGDAYEEFDKNTSDGTVDLTGAAQLTDSAVFEICVYVYYNGNDSSVTTNNIANLAAADITFSLATSNG